MKRIMMSNAHGICIISCLKLDYTDLIQVTLRVASDYGGIRFE